MPEVRRSKNGGTFIKYSDDEVLEAKNIDMISFLSTHCGFDFKSVGSYYQCREHDSLMIKQNRKTWYWNSQNLSGQNAVDWLVGVDGYTYTDALGELIGTPIEFSNADRVAEKQYVQAPSESEIEIDEVKEIELPPKFAGKYSRTFAYLNKERHIDSEIISSLMKEHLIYQDDKSNAVFVGCDENGDVRFAERKITNTYLSSLRDENGKKKFFPQNVTGSDKTYSFNLTADSPTVYVFEAPVDLLSHATIAKNVNQIRSAKGLEECDPQAWRRVNRVSLSGVASMGLEGFLERNPNVKNIVFALDNDETGRRAATELEKRYSEKGYNCKKVLPQKGKDWNEYLQLVSAEIGYNAKKEAEKSSKQTTYRGGRR